jgi:ubiquinone/menaquinone biosynthesis C-methylase UbiE
MIRLKNIIPDEDIRQVLDIGTGDGLFIRTLAELYPRAAFTGIDPSEDALENARQTFPVNGYSFLKMSSEKLAFDDNRFDMTSMSNALHHLSSPEKALAEMKRVTKHEGWMVISEIVSDNLNPAQENQKLFHHHRSKIDRLNGIYHRDTYSRNEILNLLRDNQIIPEVQFEYLRKEKPDSDADAIQKWIVKMEEHQKSARSFPDYEALEQQLEEFKWKVANFGFQPPPNLVLVIRNSKTA